MPFRHVCEQGPTELAAGRMLALYAEPVGPSRHRCIQKNIEYSSFLNWRVVSRKTQTLFLDGSVEKCKRCFWTTLQFKKLKILAWRVLCMHVCGRIL